ncbi:MAG: hypothetical protein H7Y17_10540 [Chlorobia bacterium]|nr:hypothetical protein [Fimbriimonadaceae bacterium]
MTFLVVIPTIRQPYPGFDEVMRRIEASFTLPTEFHVIDGKSGKAQTLNKALLELLPSSQAEVYVTMDDDFVPSEGWQNKVSAAFESRSDYGALGLWLGEDQEMLNYVGYTHIDKPVRANGLVLHRVRPGHHVVGCNVAMRRQVAMDVGPTPESTEKYQFWEDGWRGRRVTKLGFEQGFVEAGPVEFVRWQDTKEYQEMRIRDIESAQGKVAAFMKQGGVAPSFWARAKGKLSRILGRS